MTSHTRLPFVYEQIRSSTAAAVDSPSLLPVPRRVITKHDRDGKSTIQHIIPQHFKPYPGSKSSFSNLWTFDSVPTNDNNDSRAHLTLETSFPVDKKGLDPRNAGGQRTISGPGLGMVHAGGVTCRINDLEPGGRSTPMHRTTSTDVNTLISGQLVLVLEDGSETVLSTPGDSVIQRGTAHAWYNPSSTEWARFIAVIVDAEPVMVNNKPLRNEFWNGLGN